MFLLLWNNLKIYAKNWSQMRKKKKLTCSGNSCTYGQKLGTEELLSLTVGIVSRPAPRALSSGTHPAWSEERTLGISCLFSSICIDEVVYGYQNMYFLQARYLIDNFYFKKPHVLCSCCICYFRIWLMLHAFKTSTQRGRGRQIYVNFRHTWST